MSFISHLRCLSCGKEHRNGFLAKETKHPIYLCEEDFGPLDVVYNYGEVKKVLTKEAIEKREKNLWTCKELLPVDNVYVDLGTRYSPLIKSKTIGKGMGIELFFKNDAVNPTYSFKDRPVGIAINCIIEFGIKDVDVASTGNLAAATAAWGSVAGLNVTIYLPKGLERGKIKQIAAYGVRIVEIDGSYDDANRMVLELCERNGHAVPNANFRPYYKEGSKTIAFETTEQLGWILPDYSIFPLGSGALYCSADKGFNELKTLGLVDGKRTRMCGVQDENASPIIDAIPTGEIKPVNPNKAFAKSIAIGSPGSGYQALEVMKESEGFGWKVSKEEITVGIKELARMEGILAEPVGGAVIAGLKRGVNNGEIEAGSIVVANITGCGLKTLDAIA